MITVGLSMHEINLITKILDEHKVQYKVDAAGGSEDVKAKGGRGDTSFYQIEIHDGQFMMMPEADRLKLADLGIYPELEVPDFSQEESIKTKAQKDPEKSKQTMKKFERIFIVVMAIMLMAFIRKVLTEN
jgi:hypothetical protein